MGKPKILVVEDEGIIAKHIESILLALNYDVPAVVATAEEAIGKAGEIRPDLVLMDIVLKGKIDGIQAAEHLHHRLGIPVVYLTAHIDDATLERAKIAEPFGYLVKPFQDRELQSTIEVALYKHQMEKALKEREKVARKWAQEEEILTKIGRVISSTFKIEDIYAQFASAVSELLPFDRIAINLIDHETGSFSVAYSSGPEIPGLEIKSSHSLKGTINQKMIETYSPVLLIPKRFEDIESEYPFIRGRWQAGYRSFLSAPLIFKNRVIGGLHLLSQEPAAYTDQNLGLIQRIADQIAGAIANAQLLSKLQATLETLEKSEKMTKRLAQENVLLAKLGRMMGSTLEIGEIYEGFAEIANQLIPFDRISISLLSEDRSTFIIAYVSGAPIPGRQPGDGYPANGSLAEDMLKHGTAIILNLDEGDEMLTCFPHLQPSFEAGFRSSLRVPLVSKGQAFGIMGIHSKTPHFYNDHHLKLGERLGAEISGAIANAQLFSQVKQMLEALQESEKRYRTLVDALGQAGNGMVVLQDIGPKEAVIVSANEAAQNITGYSAEELRNFSWMDIVHPSMREMALDRIRRRMRGESMPGIYESLIRNKNGQEIPIELTATGSEIQGKPTLIGFFREITQRKLLESQLVQAQKLEAIGQLAAGIAHEINTPIQYVGDNTRFFQDAFRDLNLLLQKYEHLRQAIQTGAGTDGLVEEIQTLSQKVDPDYLVKEIPKAITQTLEGVDRVANIVRAMKEFSHPQTKDKTAVNINRAIENTITIARNEWKYVAEVETNLDPFMPLVPCLAGELNQVILNMIINAAHAIADALGDPPAGKGKITIQTSHDDRWAEIRISDTGTGIPPEIQSRIFDPFFTTKQVGKGSGQGLSIAHSIIVKRHRGKIHFETEMGKGTTFIIQLPINESSGAEGGRPEDSGRPNGKDVASPGRSLQGVGRS